MFDSNTFTRIYVGLGVIQMVTGLQRLGWIDPSKTKNSRTHPAVVALLCVLAASCQRKQLRLPAFIIQLGSLVVW